jgi:hypothetical protein
VRGEDLLHGADSGAGAYEILMRLAARE